VDAIDINNHKPLWYAVEHRRHNVVEVLIDRIAGRIARC